MQVLLGIDPGSINLGYALVGFKAGPEPQVKALDFGVIRNSKASSYERLGLIHQSLEKIVQEYKPQAAAVEKVFLGKNPQSVFRLGLARGAALSVLSIHEVPIHEYAPKSMKKFVTGTGNASKTQIQWTVKRLLRIQADIGADAADALGLAYVLARQCIGAARKPEFVLK